VDKILLVAAIAFLYSSPSLAVDENQVFGGFQYSLASYHDDGVDGAKSTALAGKYRQLTNENMAIEAKSVDGWMARRSSAPGAGIGIGVTPLFDTYGVFRTSSSQDKSTYLALGFISDELSIDETGTSDSLDESGFLYGFGVNSSSFNFEYMMSVDQGNYEVSAIGMSLTSEF
jgi:hypothetical protein